MRNNVILLALSLSGADIQHHIAFFMVVHGETLSDSCRVVYDFKHLSLFGKCSMSTSSFTSLVPLSSLGFLKSDPRD